MIFAAAAVPYIRRYHLSTQESAGIYCSFLLALALVLAPAVPAVQQAFAGRFQSRARGFLLLPLWCAPYLVYAAATGDFHWNALARLLLPGAVILAIYLVWPVSGARLLGWQDLAVAAVLIGAVLGRALGGIWNVPVHLDFMTRLFLIALAAWSWTFVRPVPGLGFSFRISAGILAAAGRNFLFFAAVALPAGLLLGFAEWNPRWHGAGNFLLAYLEIFLFIALLEELFFRGFLQNLLAGRIGPTRSQALIAGLFGMFHILHAPFPNWRYVLLAAAAGWFYGSAFRSTQNLMAPALLHAAVDTVWRTWFTRA